MSRPATPETVAMDAAAPHARRRRELPNRERSTRALAWYETVRIATLLYCSLRGGVRATGRENLPRTGGALIVSNHQSHLDVFVVGLGSPRPLNYVARSSLFTPLLGPLIRSVGGFPIERESGGIAGMKETLRRLRAGKLVLIFPEGTRSRDGTLGPLKPGIAALGRAGVPFVPTAVAGTHEAWPPGRILPRAHPFHIHYGEPITPEEIAGLPADSITTLIRDRIRQSQVTAQYHLRRLLGQDGNSTRQRADETL